MFNFNFKDILSKILIFLLCLLPISLVLSIFLSELILIAIIINFLILNYYKKNSREVYKINFFKYFIFFWILLIVSSLLSDSMETSIRTSFFYFRFGFLVLIIKYLLDYEKKFTKYFFFSLGITLLLLSIYTFLQIFILKNAVDPNRISGLFGEELVQGSYIIRTLPIFLGLIYMSDILKKNMFLIISIFIGTFLIIFSGERSSIVNLGILLFFTIIFFPFNFNKKILFTATISIFIIFLITFFDGVRHRVIKSTMESIFDNNRIIVFSYGHQSHFLSALEMIKKNFIVGIGPRNFRIECQKRDYEYIGIYRCSTHPHNTYLEIFAETGILGFLTIFILLSYILKNLIKLLLLKNNRTNYISFFFFNIGIFINIFPFLPSGSFFNNWMSFLYYLPVAFFLYESKNLAIK